jgi:CobQ-like glutamine amidotransferase family enzyme
VTTRRREPRAVGEVLAQPYPGWGLPLLTGYENHGGGSTLGPAAQPLARVLSGIGNGGELQGTQATEGMVQGQVWATYLHGPVLARNPELADRLLALAAGVDQLDPFEAPYVAELRAEREAYIRSGRLSAESARTPR